MKTFYQYIQLNEVYGQESMSKELFNLPVAGKDGDIMSFKIPMGDANIKRVMPKEIRGPVFHVTSESTDGIVIMGATTIMFFLTFELVSRTILNLKQWIPF